MILLLDLETTGTDETRHAIAQIGAAWLDAPGTFFRRVRPDESRPAIDPDALRVNGETMNTLADPARTPEHIAVCELLGWVKARSGDRDRVMFCGWNVHFDHRFLRDAFRRVGVDMDATPFRHSLLDLHALVWREQAMRREPEDAPIFGDIVRGADHAAQILGLESEARPHNALTGALHARRVAFALAIPGVVTA